MENGYQVDFGTANSIGNVLGFNNRCIPTIIKSLKIPKHFEYKYHSG